MSDLISRSELLKVLSEAEDKYRAEHDYSVMNDDPFSDGILSAMLSVFQIVTLQPTAYSVDKVVEQLEKQRSGLTEWAEDEAFKLAIDRAIEIVKQGGVTKNCNNCANYTEPDEVDNGCYLCCKGYEDDYEPKVDNSGVSDDVCEWTLTDTRKVMPYKTSCGNEDLYDNSWKYCPHCSKKIKVVE